MTPKKKNLLKKYEYHRAYFKLYNRARQRAMSRLAKAHPAEFAQLLKEEREFVELEEEEKKRG